MQAAGFLLQQHCAGEVDEVHLAGVQHQPWPVALAHEALQVVAGAEEDRAFDAQHFFLVVALAQYAWCRGAPQVEDQRRQHSRVDGVLQRQQQRGQGG